MFNINNLSKREKLLIYILTLVLVIFIYISFIRSNKSLALNKISENENIKKEIESQIIINNNLKSNINDNKELQVTIDNINNNFGTNKYIDNFIIENNLNLISFSNSNIQKVTSDNFEYFFIDKEYSINGNINTITELLKNISQNKDLHIESYNIIRQDMEDFNLNLKLREYTFKELPITGIVKMENNNSNNEINENSNLIESLYGNKEEPTNNKEDKEIINNKKSEDKTSENISYSNSNNQKNNTSIRNTNGVKETNTSSEKIESEVVTDMSNPKKEIAINSDNLNQTSLITSDKISKINDYRRLFQIEKNKNFSFILDEEFIINNNDFISNNTNFDSINHFTDNLSLTIIDSLILSDENILINDEFIYLEVEGPEDTKISIYTLDSTYKLYEHTLYKISNDKESFVVDISELKIPLKIESIILNDKLGGEIDIYNLSTFKK